MNGPMLKSRRPKDEVIWGGFVCDDFERFAARRYGICVDGLLSQLVGYVYLG